MADRRAKKSIRCDMEWAFFVVGPCAGESGAKRRLRGLPFGVPARQYRAPVPVQHLGADLQRQVAAPVTPTHLLFLHEPFTDHLVDGRFHEGRGNDLSLPITLAVVWD